jgi:hypothetical protein
MRSDYQGVAPAMQTILDFLHQLELNGKLQIPEKFIDPPPDSRFSGAQHKVTLSVQVLERERLLRARENAGTDEDAELVMHYDEEFHRFEQYPVTKSLLPCFTLTLGSDTVLARMIAPRLTEKYELRNKSKAKVHRLYHEQLEKALAEKQKALALKCRQYEELYAGYQSLYEKLGGAENGLELLSNSSTKVKHQENVKQEQDVEMENNLEQEENVDVHVIQAESEIDWSTKNVKCFRCHRHVQKKNFPRSRQRACTSENGHFWRKFPL